MVFTKYVEIGRVVFINFGEDYGKLATIINVIDNNTVLVDGPRALTGVGRKTVNIKRLTLTDIKLDVGVHAREKSLKKAFEKQNVLNEWKKSALAKKLESRKKRKSMTDFDRFKLMLARKAKSKAVKKKLAELRG